MENFVYLFNFFIFSKSWLPKWNMNFILYFAWLTQKLIIFEFPFENNDPCKFCIINNLQGFSYHLAMQTNDIVKFTYYFLCLITCDALNKNQIIKQIKLIWNSRLFKHDHIHLWHVAWFCNFVYDTWRTITTLISIEIFERALVLQLQREIDIAILSMVRSEMLTDEVCQLIMEFLPKQNNFGKIKKIRFYWFVHIFYILCKCRKDFESCKSMC